MKRISLPPVFWTFLLILDGLIDQDYNEKFYMSN